MIRRPSNVLVPLLLAGLALAACAERERIEQPVARPPAAQVAPGPAIGGYKVGAPYQVDGVWYYPKADYAYRETGVASWYGPGFAGRRTANGEVYDPEALTAAHPTLPIPSMVRVTNLDNGRSIKVRVNDRGPFKNGRIIDLSRRAAELLGFLDEGTAKVQVEIVEAESRRLAVAALSEEAAARAPAPVPIVPVDAESLTSVNGAAAPARAAAPRAETARAAIRRPVAAPRPPVVAPEPDGAVARRPVRPSAIYVQAGAFTRLDNANRLRARLAPLGDVQITEAVVEARRYFRVRIGPVRSVEDADRVLAALIANGHPDARVVVD